MSLPVFLGGHCGQEILVVSCEMSDEYRELLM